MTTIDQECLADLLYLPHVKSQEKGNENARDDNVSQSKHGKVFGSQTILQ